MAIQRQLRRGTKAENDAFTGAIGELVQDTDNDRIIVHDGSKQGGFPVPNYQDVASQHFTAVDASGTDTITLTLPYALNAYAEYQKFTFKPAANNTGAATLNVNSLGAKDIQKDDGSGTLVDLEADDLKANIPVDVIYDGTQVILQLGGGGSLAPVANITLSSVSTYEFTNIFQSGNVYTIYFNNVTPSSDGAILRFRLSNDGGSTFLTSGTKHIKTGRDQSNTEITNVGLNEDYAEITTAVGSATGEAASGYLRFYNPADSTNETYFEFMSQYENTSGLFSALTGGGIENSSVAVDTIEFSFTSGDLESGIISIYEEPLS